MSASVRASTGDPAGAGRFTPGGGATPGVPYFGLHEHHEAELAEQRAPAVPQRRIGRYALFEPIATGGMATVYFGQLQGSGGFSRTVAVKQLHPQFATSRAFVAQFLDEARLTARIRHPNVVSTLDVAARDGELFVVMEYVQGETISRLLRDSGGPVPAPVACAILVGALLGLHAAHEATSDSGEPLCIVHRDVSPQNILVGLDGAAHVLDFGVAKAASRLHTTEAGQIKGKLAYMSPEQVSDGVVDRRADVFAAGVVLWEMLTCKRLFAREDPGSTIAAILRGNSAPPSSVCPDLPPELDAVVLKSLAWRPEDRFATARDMALALESSVPLASVLRVGQWVESVAAASLEARAQRVAQIEEAGSTSGIEDTGALAAALKAAQGTSRLAPGDGPRGIIDEWPRARADEPTIGAIPEQLRARREPARKRKLLAAAGGAALLLGAGLAVALMAPTEPPGAPVTASTAPSPSPPPALAPIAPSSAPGPTTTSGGSERPSRPPTALSSRPPRRSSALRRVSEPARVGNCIVPFVKDYQGRKRFKPECF